MNAVFIASCLVILIANAWANSQFNRNQFEQQECRGHAIVSGKCLTFSRDAKNWHEADTACASEGGTLVTLEDPDAAADVLQFVKETFGTAIFWAGGTDFEREGTWKWINNHTTFRNDFQWTPSNPDNCCGGQNCLQMNWQGGFDDQLCHARNRYICQL